MATDKKTKEELMVENAILKSYDIVRVMLKEELSPLKLEVGKMDSRLKAVEDELEVIRETIRPFTTFRRRAWGILISFILGGGALALVWFEISKYNGGSQ